MHINALEKKILHKGFYILLIDWAKITVNHGFWQLPKILV